MRGVADYLAAGRSAGRYLLTIASGIAGLGAITVVANLEMGYEAGFAMSWWGLTMALFMVVVTVSGWVNYRFRRTRALTLAEFFERRYSRRFRIFAGSVAFRRRADQLRHLPRRRCALLHATTWRLPEFVQLGPLAHAPVPGDHGRAAGHGGLLRARRAARSSVHDHRLHPGRLRQRRVPDRWRSTC